jgi:hypothetical protein
MFEDIMMQGKGLALATYLKIGSLTVCFQETKMEHI